MYRLLLVVVFLVSVPVAASAQNLDKLLGRAQGYLASRVSGSKSDMARYFPSDKRNKFLDRNPPPMSKAHIQGIEFTSDPKSVYVVYDATVAIENVGPVPLTIREPWIWDGKEWFLKLDEVGNPFGLSKNTTTPTSTTALPFELLGNRIDFGRHIQGEIIKRTVDFKSDKENFNTFRQSGSEGLLVVGPEWTSKEMGHFEVVLDTTLLNSAAKHSVHLEILGYRGQKTDVVFEVTAEVEPRLKFDQTPPVIDPGMGGTVEIQMTNLSTVPFKPKSLVLQNSAYRISDYTAGDIAPGNTLKVIIQYDPQPDPTGAALNVETSPAVLAKPGFILPLNVKLPVSSGAGYTKEELDEIVRRAPK